MAVVSGGQPGGKDRHEWIGRQEEELFIALALIEDKDETRRFLLDILSSQEVQRIAKRWYAVRLLLEGMTQTKARTFCNINKNTMTNINRKIINNGSGICRILYRRYLSFGKKK